MKNHRFFISLFLLFAGQFSILNSQFSIGIVSAQEQKSVTVSGSVQTDMLVPQNDEQTGAMKDEAFQANVYADLMVQSRYVDAGARFEYLEHPLPGFEKDFQGWGVPNFWVKARWGCAELTGGTFYEQFGSGFILRTYEERPLGIDNSLLGGRVVLKPYKGITVKALTGVQRHYWKLKKSFEKSKLRVLFSTSFQLMRYSVIQISLPFLARFL